MHLRITGGGCSMADSPRIRAKLEHLHEATLDLTSALLQLASAYQQQNPTEEPTIVDKAVANLRQIAMRSGRLLTSRPADYQYAIGSDRPIAAVGAAPPPSVDGGEVMPATELVRDTQYESPDASCCSIFIVEDSGQLHQIPDVQGLSWMPDPEQDFGNRIIGSMTRLILIGEDNERYVLPSACACMIVQYEGQSGRRAWTAVSVPNFSSPGTGLSIDDIVVEEHYNFHASALRPWTPGWALKKQNGRWEKSEALSNWLQ